jgi:hypothetical protein
MRVFLVHVRYWGSFLMICIGLLLMLPGGWLVALGKWIGSRSK